MTARPFLRTKQSAYDSTGSCVGDPAAIWRVERRSGPLRPVYVGLGWEAGGWPSDLTDPAQDTVDCLQHLIGD